MNKKFTNPFDPFVPVKMNNAIQKKTSETGNLGSNFEEFISEFDNTLTVNTKLKIGTPGPREGFVLLIASKAIGKENGLGEKLLSDFLFNISDGINLPQYVIFMNEAVLLLDEENSVCESLRKMRKNGVKLLASVESLNYFDFACGCKGVMMATVADISEKILFSKQLVRL